MVRLSHEALAWTTLQRQFPRIRGHGPRAVLDLITRLGPIQSQVPRSPFLTSSSPGLSIIGDDTELLPDSTDQADAYGIALRLSEENPSVFGYPLLTESGIQLPVMSATKALLGAHDDETLTNALDDYESRRESRASGDFEVTKTLSATSEIVLSSFSKHISTTLGETTRAELEKTKNGVFDVAVAPEFVKSAQPTGAGISSSTGLVVLTVELLTEGLADAILKQFDGDLVAIHLAKRPEEMRSARGGRQADDDPFYGGAEIFTAGSVCSSGFTWSSAGTTPMLTAGHCAPNGDDIVTTSVDSNMGEIDAGSRETWNDGTGSVPLTGQSAYRGDFAMIRMAIGKESWARAYRGGINATGYNTGREMWHRRAANGDTFCTSGRTTGENCGWTVYNTGYIAHYANEGAYARPMVVGRKTTGNDIDGGDSGGSIFTERPDGYLAAKGIISGERGGACDTVTPCIFYFTDIWDPYCALPGVLKTGYRP